jgi:hypothetical protein
MKSLLKRICRGKYDPIAYWNSRPNPNNVQGESPERVNFDAGYIRRAIEDFDPILELGPGVGRTFSAYNKGRHVTTLDISHEYAGKLSSVGQSLGLHLNQCYLTQIYDPFPFGDKEFSVGVASQVLLHIPPEFIRHSMSELVRVCEKVVIITAYTHGFPTKRGYHVFNHDYFGLCTDLGCAMHDVIMNEGRICFTLRKFIAC